MVKLVASCCIALILSACSEKTENPNQKIPVIVITDLYHPAQDPGDNFDIITAFALPQIDLKAVILDCTEPFRQPVANNPGEGLFPDPNGPREPGYIPLLQLNYIFDRNIPFAVGPFSKMKNLNDKMLDIPYFQQQGIELLISTLKSSSSKIQILSFGSLRVLAAAYNREPALFMDKVRQIHISAGASGPDFLEWNIALDREALKTIITSELPVALYPCAAESPNGKGYGSYNYPFSYSSNNTFYSLSNLNFISQMDTVLQRYLAYAFNRCMQNDFLRAMENDSVIKINPPNYSNEHYVWETAIWLNVAKMKLVSNQNGIYKIINESELSGTDSVINNDLHPCMVELCKNGYVFKETTKSTNFSIFYRDNPYLYEKALQHALPELYKSFKTGFKLSKQVYSLNAGNPDNIESH
jgi:pyrimidine-specific ribonucleoside hydrolase